MAHDHDYRLEIALVLVNGWPYDAANGWQVPSDVPEEKVWADSGDIGVVEGQSISRGPPP